MDSDDLILNHRAATNRRMQQYDDAHRMADRKAANDALLGALAKMVRDGKHAMPDMLGPLDEWATAQLVAENWSRVAR